MTHRDAAARRAPLPMLAAIAVTAVTAVAACGDDDGRRGADLDLDGRDTIFAGAEPTLAEGDVFAALSENGAVKLGLTQERVYFELSDSLRRHVDSEIGTELEGQESQLARSIGSAVRRGVARALEFRIQFDVADIRDVDYRDGDLVFDFENASDARTLRSTNVDDEPLTSAFSEEDARAFVAAFDWVKAAARSGDAPAAPPPGGDTTAGTS